MIYEVVDGAFRIFMWMLLDPTGRNVFYTLDTIGIVGGIAYLIWDTRREDALEKTRRPSNSGTQQKGTEGEDEGAG